MALSSKVPLFNLRALNKDLPVGKAFPNGPPVAVVGAANDLVVVQTNLPLTYCYEVKITSAQHIMTTSKKC